MQIAYKLGKDEEEVIKWPRKRLFRWMAYFKMVAQMEKDAIKDAQDRMSSGRGRQTNVL